MIEETGTWTPKNNKVDIVVGDSEYNTLIAEGTKKAIATQRRQVGARQVSRSRCRAVITDWSPILQKLQESDAGVIMIDHWIGAELAALRAAVHRQPGARRARVPAVRPVPARVPRHRRRGGRGLLLGHHDRRAEHGQGRRVPRRVRGEVPGHDVRHRLHRLVLRHGHMLKDAWTNVDPSDTKAVMRLDQGQPVRRHAPATSTSRTSRRRCTRRTPTRPRGRHAPVLPGAGRRAQDRAARGVQGRRTTSPRRGARG